MHDPLAATPLRGRVEEVRRVVEVLGTPGVRLVALTGLAGVGKSRIARAVAARVEDEAERAMVWVDMTRLLDAELFDPALARAAGIAGWDPTATGGLGAALDTAPRLVVLDGFDTGPSDDAMRDRLSELVREAHATRFLLTARTPHRIPGGRLLRIDPLPTGDAAGGELRSRPGVELFVDIATSVGAAAPTDDDLVAIDAVVERLGGNPLAIRLTASRSTTFSPSTLLSLLDRPSPNSMFASSVLSATGELRESIDWSIAQLDEDQVTLLHDLTAFQGPVPVEAVESLTAVEECIGALSQLVDVHLVDADHTDAVTTFSLPPIVREHVAMRTDDQDEAALRERHQRWAVAFAASETAAGTGEAHASTPGVQIVDIELMSALQRALEFDDAAAAGVLVVALAPKWLSELTQDVHVDLVRRTARLLESSRADDEVLALVHGWLALLLAERAAGPNSLDEADTERIRALELARHLDPMVRLRVLALAVRTGRAYVDRGPLVECCDEALQLASEQGAEGFLARFEIWGGMLAHQNGDLDRACGLATAARQRGLHLDDASLIVTATAFLRTLPETTTRDLDLPSASQIVASARACDEQRVLLWMLPSASVEALADGDLRTATEYDIELLERARDAGAWIWTALPAITQSEVAVHHGDHLGAARLHGFARNHMYVLEAMLPPARLVRFRAICDDVRTSSGAAAYDEAAAGGSLLSPGEATIEMLATARQHLARIDPSEPAGRDGQPGDDGQRSPLTARELGVVELLVAGDSNKDIARCLGISPKTVMHHTSSIYRKLGVRGRAEAVAWSVRQEA